MTGNFRVGEQGQAARADLRVEGQRDVRHARHDAVVGAMFAGNTTLSQLEYQQVVGGRGWSCS